MALDSNAVVGVVGAGAMGTGIAQVAATAGHRVVLGDAMPRRGREGAGEHRPKRSSATSRRAG